MINVIIQDSNMWDEIHQENELIPYSIQKNKDKLNKIASEVLERNIKKAIFVGRGSSEHALQAARLFFEIECNMTVEIYNPSVISRYHANVNLKDYLVVGISQCGEAQDVWDVLQTALKQGALVVSITNADNALMNNIEKYYLNLEVGKELSFTAAKSYLAQLALMLELGAIISKNTKLIDSIENCGMLIAKCYGIEQDIRNCISLFRNVSDITLIGRGYSYAIALEAELKIQEASYTNARAYSSADYQHGPISTTNRYTPFIFYLTDEKTDESTISLINKLKKNFNISSLVVTNKEKYLNLGDYGILLPSEAEGYLSMFSNAIFSQMFACILSFARGHHPDKPYGLSKVTVTV
ncbi:MAG: SIS domain-containing protein [Erysipelotrichaceae bacterium]|nr:SIS domain-containing protein [Erysipelotrichaceae bacterium]